jgi:hypothetical protein
VVGDLFFDGRVVALVCLEIRPQQPRPERVVWPRPALGMIVFIPDQIDLINGILTPCTMEQALSATDGDILAYPSYLVEENETTLIKELQDFIKV